MNTLETEIIEVDNFFPIFLEKKLTSIFYNGQTLWALDKSRTYNKSELGYQQWKKNHPVEEHDTFLHNVELHDPANSYVISNLKNISENKFNIIIDDIFRIRYVYTPPNPYFDGYTFGYPHVDAKFDHYTILYYLADSDADTIFFNQKYVSENTIDYSKQEVIKRVTPKKNKAVLFNGLIFHAGNVSRTMKRLTINMNFTLKNNI